MTIFNIYISLKQTNLIGYNESKEVITLNMYFTSGTEDYLKKIIEDNKKENLLFMHNEDTSLLAHETEGNSIFKAPRKYEVIISTGAIIVPSGFAVFNHIPVTDEGRPLFEYHYKNRAKLIEKEPGFLAIRVLRPSRLDTYIIFTLWKNESAFKQWQTSNSFSEADFHLNTGEKGEKKQPNIFLRPSFVTKYKIYEKKNI